MCGITCARKSSNYLVWPHLSWFYNYRSFCLDLVLSIFYAHKKLLLFLSRNCHKQYDIKKWERIVRAIQFNCHQTLLYILSLSKQLWIQPSKNLTWKRMLIFLAKKRMTWKNLPRMLIFTSEWIMSSTFQEYVRFYIWVKDDKKGYFLMKIYKLTCKIFWWNIKYSLTASLFSIYFAWDNPNKTTGFKYWMRPSNYAQV